MPPTSRRSVPAPEPVGWDGVLLPMPRTPDTPTIETLVAHLNEHFPREDRAWTAGDTLKNVVVMLVHPDGTRAARHRRAGDRDVDEKRLGAQVEPAEVEAFDEKAFAEPWARQGLHQAGALGTEGTTGIRYLLDPRISEGAVGDRLERAGRHVIDLVVGVTSRATGRSRRPRCAVTLSEL